MSKKTVPDWKRLKAGDRVELVSTNDPYTDMAPGTRGVMLADAPENPTNGGVTIRASSEPDADTLDEYTVLSVKWDTGSWLQMIPEAGDVLVAVKSEVICEKCSSDQNITPIEFSKKPEGGWWRCSEGHEFRHQTVVLRELCSHESHVIPQVCLADHEDHEVA